MADRATEGLHWAPVVVVVGASAGGVEALQRLVAGLPPDLDAVVLVVLHVSPRGMSVLPDILTRAGRLRAAHASDGDPLTPGTILVAPPDRHLVVDGEVARVTTGPRRNGHRPAIDELFESAAEVCGHRVIGVLLSGMLEDGASGLRRIHDAGGITLVQDPAEAAYPSMPVHAIAEGGVTHVLPLDALATMLVRCVADVSAIIEAGP